MKNYATLLRATSVALTLLAALLASSTSPASSARAQGGSGALRPATVVLAVESLGGEVTVDPILEVGAGARVKAAGDATGENDSLKRFVADYFKRGSKYRVISGGGAAGTLTIKQATAEAECFRTVARADLRTTARLGGNVFAFATDSEALGGRTPSRREPTAGERAGVEELARTLLTRRLTSTQLRGLRTINMTATDLDDDCTADIAGTFRVNRGASSAEQLFLLAESKAGGYAAAFANYHAVKSADLPDPSIFKELGKGGTLSEILLEQLGPDGDGTDELFTLGRSLEGVRCGV